MTNKKPRKQISHQEFLAALEWSPETKKHAEKLGEMCEEFLAQIRRVKDKSDE